MEEINYRMFEEFKRLENLCNEIYSSRNGVTNYIDEMKEVPYAYWRKIEGWENDLRQLKRLRYIRNVMAHREGGFETADCTEDDILWIQNFYDRIMEQSDPLARLRSVLISEANMKGRRKRERDGVPEENQTDAVFRNMQINDVLKNLRARGELKEQRTGDGLNGQTGEKFNAGGAKGDAKNVKKYVEKHSFFVNRPRKRPGRGTAGSTAFFIAILAGAVILILVLVYSCF